MLALQKDAPHREGYEKQIEDQVLAPGEVPDHPATGTGDSGEKMQKDGSRVDRKQHHQGQGRIKGQQPAVFEHQGGGDRDLQQWDTPD